MPCREDISSTGLGLGQHCSSTGGIMPLWDDPGTSGRLQHQEDANAGGCLHGFKVELDSGR